MFSAMPHSPIKAAAATPQEWCWKQLVSRAANARTSRAPWATPRRCSWRGPANPGHFRTRYYSPLAEVAFCGHATIAAAVAFAERHGAGRLLLDTLAGSIVVETVAEV